MSESLACTVRMTGRLEIPAGCKPYHPEGNPQSTDGFILPDGRIVRPMMMFEIEDQGNFSEPTSNELESLGIQGAGEIDFREVEIG